MSQSSHDIEIRKDSCRSHCYHVRVSHVSGTRTHHVVCTPPDFVARCGVDSTNSDSVEALIRRSFIFLLKREQQGDILNQFSLSDIELYHSDYIAYITKEAAPSRVSVL